MTEQKLEKKILDVFQTIFAGEIPDLAVQFVGSLQTGADATVEHEDAEALVTVAVTPRSYDSPMVPTATIPCTLSIAVRAELDPKKELFVGLMSLALERLARWQACMDDVHATFDIPDEFTLGGFRLAQAATPSDPTKTVWAYAHSFELLGVFAN